MATTDLHEQSEDLKKYVLSGIEAVFPIRDRAGKYEVKVSGLEAADTKDEDSIKEQTRHRMEGLTWAIPVHGNVSLIDTESGKELVSKRMLIAKIPKMTRHYSYIINGQERTITNQWRLRPGPFIKPTAKPGKFEAQFQLKGRSFDLQTDDGGALVMALGTRTIPLYSLMQAHGFSDDQLQKAWGADTFAASKAKSKGDRGLKSFVEGWTDRPATGDLTAAMKDIFANTHMDASVAQANLGVSSPHVTGDVLLAASRKLLDVSAGRATPDPIDSLRYKELWQAKDQLADRIQKSLPDIKRRVQSALSKKSVLDRLTSGDPGVLRDVVMPDLIQRPIHFVFNTSLSATGKQTNPVSMMADNSMVTITGPGGIENPHAITASNTAIDPSHLGFLDPVFTPESEAGKTTHLAFGVTIRDRRPYAKLYSVKEKKLVDVDAPLAAVSNVVLPDQVNWKGGHPEPVGKSVRMSDSSGDIRDRPFSDAQYVMPSAAQVFSVETNLVPFMGNDSAGRTTMSARHMAQAISIEGREAPMVQVEAGSGKTFESIIGHGFLAQNAPIAGKVMSVRPGEIVIRPETGKPVHVSIYNHYPTNHAKGMLHATPLVKVGDEVKAGQLLADTNFTKNGVLALGTNLRTAYLANGLNHEDGIVISESAQKKLESVHLHKPSVYVPDTAIVGREAFLTTAHSTVYRPEQVKKIGNDGVVRVGEIVRPGDPLVLKLDYSPDVTAIDASARTKLGKQLRTRRTNGSLVWDSDYEGEVVGVSRANGSIEVHVKTREPAQIGSKISTRHSAKGIVTAILPDKEMPHDVQGKHVEMLINPVSVPGRQNAGQILETAAGKIAEKTGKTYTIKNFRPGVDYLKQVKDELKEHGLTDTEVLIDPKTGRKLGSVLVGPHYAFQLEHQIDVKSHARSGGRSFPHLEMPTLRYDKDTGVPSSGGHTAAQSLGSLGLYGALAAGLHANIGEMQTLKSDEKQAMQTWSAITDGQLIPRPRAPWAAKKFETLLQGLGVTVTNTGGEVRIMPRSDAETRGLSHGELSHASKAIRVRDTGEVPFKGGLFDLQATGGPGGHRWSHIELVESMPHPMFSKQIATALGVKAGDIAEIIEGKKTLPGGAVGGAAFKAALAKLDLDKELESVRQKIKDPKVKDAKLGVLNSQFHSLSALKERGLHPKDAWTIKAVPVIPPVFRPLTTMDDGQIRNNPLNSLYRRLGAANESLKHGDKLPYKSTLDTRAGIYNELENLFGTVAKGKKALELDIRGTRESPGKPLPGIIHMISGDKPKDGFFQDKLTGKRMDYTARVTIVADPSLSTDELGVPKKVAMELYRPMVARRLIAAGYDPEEAQLKVSRKDPVAIRALEQEIKIRPLMVKRDPVLHQYGIVGQNVLLTDSKAIKMSPLVLPPLGADVDGDQVTLMVPLSPRAVEEVRRITPSQRPLADASGDVLFTPANESALSIYRMSIPRGKPGGVFGSAEAAEAAFNAGKVQLNTPIHVTGLGDTTLGRVRVAKVVPEQYRKGVLNDLDKPLDRKFQAHVLRETVKKSPNAFLSVADGLSRLGFRMAYESGHTVTLADLEPLREEREKILVAAKKDVDKIDPKNTDAVTARWIEATKDLHQKYREHHDRAPSNISDMAAAGIKAKSEQFQGLVMAPMLVEDHLGRPSRVPITKSFAEGIDVGGYFLQAAGARRGVIQKTESVSEPGYMTKMLLQVSMDQPITMKDCGTHQGIALPLSDRDIIDRHLATPISLGGHTIPAGTIVTPDIAAKAKEARIDNLVVRSPLKCRAPRGVCSVCMGVHPTGQHYGVGENAGIISAQAIGERAAQLMLKQTHGGGIVPVERRTTDEFNTVQRLFAAAAPSVADAAVAPTEAVIKKISKGNDGVWNIWTDGRSKPLRSNQEPLSHVRVGYEPKRGELLTRGEPNPHALMHASGLEAAQSYMAKKIGDIYAQEGVLRRHAELTVRNASSVVRIDDPGDHSGFIRGDYAHKPTIDELNRLHSDKAPIRFSPKLAAITEIPHYVNPDWIGQLQGQDLKRTIQRAAAFGQRSSLHGVHPIPGVAFGVHGNT